MQSNIDGFLGIAATFNNVGVVQIGGPIWWDGGEGWLTLTIGGQAGNGSMTLNWMSPTLIGLGNIPVPEVNALKPTVTGPTNIRFFSPPGHLSLFINAPTGADSINIGPAYLAR